MTKHLNKTGPDVVCTLAVWQDAAELASTITPNLTFVDPYTLGLLVKCHTGAVDCS